MAGKAGKGVSTVVKGGGGCNAHIYHTKSFTQVKSVDANEFAHSMSSGFRPKWQFGNKIDKQTSWQ